MDLIVESMAEEWRGLLRLLPRLAVSLLLVAVFIWTGRLIGRATTRLMERGKLSRAHRAFFGAAVSWAVALLGVMVGLNLVGLQELAAGLLAGGGVTAIVLGFAFREIGENVLAGVLLAFSRPFEVGDLIQSEDMQGVVRGIELRHTHIRSSDGQDIFIPNAQVITKPLINYTKDGLRRPSFTIGIDYADDARGAVDLLLSATAECRGVLADPKPAVRIANLGAQSVELEVAFWVDTFKDGVNLLTIRTDVMECCRLSLAEAGYTFSSNVSTNLAIPSLEPLEVRVDGSGAIDHGASS
jgi:small-conductance mechanosensitive channel